MSNRIFQIVPIVMGMIVSTLAQGQEKPQPPVFLWAYGSFQDSAEKTTELSLMVSYCGEDDDDPSLPPLNVSGNVELQIAGRPTAFTLEKSDWINRGHLRVVVSAGAFSGVKEKPFRVQWIVGDMKSNVLVADSSKRTLESETIYPRTPRPKKLQGVDRISYEDINWVEKTETHYLDRRRQVGFVFLGDGPKPWRFTSWNSADILGLKGEEFSLETKRNLYGNVSNEDVLKVWNELAALGISMPSWRDNPESEIGPNWDWFYVTNSNGERVYPERDDDRRDHQLEFPLKVVFEHKREGVDSSCWFGEKRDSEMWKAITEVFVKYSESKQDDSSIKKDVTTLLTQGDDQACTEVSLRELLANTKKFHGKRVRISGYYHAEFEHSSLSEGPGSIWDDEKSVWLGGMSFFSERKERPDPNGTFITVEGVFTAGRGGHLGMWSGEIGRLMEITTKVAEENKIEKSDTAGE